MCWMYSYFDFDVDIAISFMVYILSSVLGAEGNLFTCTRKGNGTKPVVDIVTLDILE